ncbi:MAG: single-stranded-DNA-specific exonuclease RecJ [Selenomonadaceae bacterium]|nr:single-stranded-DNA-specific exonuclease RecJ [Selenomonadaceae bacterium]
MRKKWIVKEANSNVVEKISAELGISELTAKILYQRGIRDAESAKNFLEPESAPFKDPFLMLGMDLAVERIKKALENNEKICVYGDYDVDGMSASAILIRTLRNLGGWVESYIPDRSEGYGLNVPALQKISADGAELLITVDCGITNEKEISAIKDVLDVIVTDHHLPALEKVQSAVAVVNPNQKNCPYPEKNLCGAGVAFKLSQALMNKLRGIDIQTYMTDIEIAAMATVADLVSLTGENRKIVRIGLKKMRETPCIGLKALLSSAGLGNKKISAGHVAFQIAPRLNSVGRLKTAREGLKLLLNEDVEEAKILARQLEKMNQQRKDIENKMLVEAEEKVRLMREEKGGDLCTLVIAGTGWVEGVIGLTASKLVERYNLPTIILATQDGISYRGSCRSISTLHMKNALDSMAELFEQYGGHSQAAGLSISTKNVAEFAERFDKYVREKLLDEDYQPILNVDALINPAQINFEVAEEFDKFEPYGLGNPRPILGCKNVRGSSAKAVGKEGTHLTFSISEKIRAVAWNCGNLAPLVENELIDVAYEPELNEWQGEVRIQCNISSLEPAAEGESVLRSREELLEVYNFLKKARGFTERFNICALVREFRSQSGKNISTYTFDGAIKVFEELGLLVIDRDKKTFELPRPKTKLELTNSRTYRLGLREPVTNGKIISLAEAVKKRSIKM